MNFAIWKMSVELVKAIRRWSSSPSWPDARYPSNSNLNTATSTVQQRLVDEANDHCTGLPALIGLTALAPSQARAQQNISISYEQPKKAAYVEILNRLRKRKALET